MSDSAQNDTPQDRHRRVNDRLDDIEKRLTRGDRRFDELSQKVDEVQAEVRLNTDVTFQVRDIMITFKTFTNIMKWGTAAGAFCLMLWQAMLKLTGKG